LSNLDYYTWQKGESPKLSQHFDGGEFSCHCSFPACKEQRISKALITRLELIRVESNQSITITSGYRCTAYQTHLRDSGVNTVVAKLSTHELGDAADAQPHDKNIETFLPIAAKHFDSIGTAKTFLHLDIRVGYRRWVY